MYTIFHFLQRLRYDLEEKLTNSLSHLEEETKQVMEMCNIPATPISQEEVRVNTI